MRQLQAALNQKRKATNALDLWSRILFITLSQQATTYLVVAYTVKECSRVLYYLVFKKRTPIFGFSRCSREFQALLFGAFPDKEFLNQLGYQMDMSIKT